MVFIQIFIKRFEGGIIVQITSGMSYDNGFDIRVTYGKKRCVISAIKDDDGNYFVKCNENSRSKKAKTKIVRILFLLFFSIAMSLLYNYIVKIMTDKFMRIAIVVALWIISYIAVVISSVNKKNVSKYRYHAVEHMVLSYCDKYDSLKHLQDFKNEKIIYFTCGSTLIVLLALCISNIYMIIPFFTSNIFLNMLLVICSLFIPFCLWVYDKLNFIQMRLVKTPNEEDIALGMLVLKKIYKLKKMAETENLDFTNI